MTTGYPELLRLRPGVFRTVDRSGREYLLSRSASQHVGKPTEIQRDVLRQLAEKECSRQSLLAIASGDATGAPEVDSLLCRLRAGGWLQITVIGDDGPAYTIRPHRRPGSEPSNLCHANRVLSRFAVMRRDDADLIIESPRSWCSIAVHDPSMVGALAAFTQPQAGLPAGVAGRLLHDLTWAAMVVEAPGEEDTAFELRQWSPHELWFHLRSRGEGVPEGHFGRTEWAVGKFEPLPARRASSSEQSIALARPDLDALRRDEATLTGVLEERRSIRRHDDARPITLDQVGEFLYRAAGVRAVHAVGAVETVIGPNPCGGAVDELEFYLAVRLAEGIEAGLYRYDRFGHRLEYISGPTRAVRRLIDAAQKATGGSHVPAPTYPPQLVVLLAARFGRAGWSYETLTYSLILKHVGVTYQTMYCVATAMGLAPCALGAGDPAVFAEATGLDPLIEGTVGEFILGSRPTAGTEGLDQRAAT